jgi:hypothetical protein
MLDCMAGCQRRLRARGPDLVLLLCRFHVFDWLGSVAMLLFLIGRATRSGATSTQAPYLVPVPVEHVHLVAAWALRSRSSMQAEAPRCSAMTSRSRRYST